MSSRFSFKKPSLPKAATGRPAKFAAILAALAGLGVALRSRLGRGKVQLFMTNPEDAKKVSFKDGLDNDTDKIEHPKTTTAKDQYLTDQRDFEDAGTPLQAKKNTGTGSDTNDASGTSTTA